MRVDFLDSNVFIHLFDPIYTKKRETADSLVTVWLKVHSKATRPASASR